MTMIVTLKAIENGFFKVQIKPPIGEKYYREFSQQALLQYLFDAESYCEWKGYSFSWVIPSQFKRIIAAELIQAKNSGETNQAN
jgi:hypothetical protein